MTLQSSRALAQIWPYPHRRDFEMLLQRAAAAWFAGRGLSVRPRKSYILADRKGWSANLIDPTLYTYIQTETAR